MSERFIAHVDMDAFFASVEQRDDPSLRGKPVVVGADPKGGKGRGVVSTCSYEARKFGIRSAMPISRAYRLCPSANFLPVDGPRYERVSRRIFSILGSFSPLLEPVSVDEAYLDISATFPLFGTPAGACRLMKRRILGETGLTASVGLGPTKMSAKIASDLGKPDGFVEVTREGLLDFLRPLPVGSLWGLGPKAQESMRLMGIGTVGDLASRDPREVEAAFGGNGIRFWEAANGVDDREVECPGPARSVSAESTFERDSGDRRLVESEIVSLCERVSRRLRREGVEACTVTLKVRFSDFSTRTKAHTRASPTNFTDDLISEAAKLLSGFELKGKKVRLVGVRASNLSRPDSQLTLFGEGHSLKKEKVHAAVDEIKDKFGEKAITRASAKR